MSPEQLEGYFHRLNLAFEHQSNGGPDGTFLLSFATKKYRSTIPPHDKNVQLILSLINGGEGLILLAPLLYDASATVAPSQLYKCLLNINYTIRGTHFEVDQRDGEVRCSTFVPIKDSNLSLAAVQKLLYTIPTTVDQFDTRIRKCLRATGGGAQAALVSPPPPRSQPDSAAIVDSVCRLAKVVERLALQNAAPPRKRGRQARRPPNPTSGVESRGETNGPDVSA
jgi:hypothetical protein